MTMKSSVAEPVSRSSIESALEHLERVKTMSRIMEAQLLDCQPGLAELASNLSDELDGVADRIRTFSD